jgi:hypothetical protein
MNLQKSYKLATCRFGYLWPQNVKKRERNCHGNFSIKVCAEKHQEKAKRDSQEEQKCSSRRELRWRESAAIVCSTEVLQSAVKSFQWECHIRRRIKRDSVLSVLFFMCESALGCTWGLGLERVLLSQTL